MPEKCRAQIDALLTANGATLSLLSRSGFANTLRCNSESSLFVTPDNLGEILVAVLAIALVTFRPFPAWAGPCSLPGPNQVIVYHNNDRSGSCQVLEFGDYPTAASFKLQNDSISAIDVGANTRAVLYREPHFRGRQAHFEGGFYYDPIGRINNNTSSIEVFPMQGGPAVTHFLRDHPKNSESFWAEDAQGLANDGNNWFAVQERSIFKVPLSYNLSNSSSKGLLKTGIPRPLANVGYNHLGDPDYRSGFLFATIEDTTEPRLNPRIGVWSGEDLRFLSSFEISDIFDTHDGKRDASLPWLAIHPRERTLWVSHSKADHVTKYDIDWERLTGTANAQLVLTNPRRIRLLDRDGTTITLNSMQGGVFNPSGTLLYTSNNSSDGYVHVFYIDDRTNTATLQARSEDGYFPFNFEINTSVGEEAEGLDWLDVQGLNIPGISDGQLHLVMIDNDVFDDDEVYVKHFQGRTDEGIEVPEPSTLTILGAGMLGLLMCGFYRRTRGRRLMISAALGTDTSPSVHSIR
jgi:hypothetical protein